MARYRIGNRFLSQEEYDAEMDWKWVCGLFLAGAIITGYLVNHYAVNTEWHQAIRFFVTTLPAIGVGAILVKLRFYIRIFISLAIIILFVAMIIGIVASLV
ncbi:hypothetical protein POV99_21160 [Enterobacter kobei]|uniref:hypothetical protein n=1 Tax=Enterobacter kobei TaxID=208224 RepID=UPI002FFB527A